MTAHRVGNSVLNEMFIVFLFYFWFILVQKGCQVSHSEAQAGPELMVILLPQSIQYWDYRIDLCCLVIWDSKDQDGLTFFAISKICFREVMFHFGDAILEKLCFYNERLSMDKTMDKFYYLGIIMIICNSISDIVFLITWIHSKSEIACPAYSSILIALKCLVHKKYS